jgi:succinyl-diaminopimelate desuccinylase
MATEADRILDEVDRLRDELVEFARELVRIPTVNPPGDAYDTCARALGERLRRSGFEIDYVPADGRPEHTALHPRINVVGTRRGSGRGRVVHLNGHLDVVPPGAGWTVDPFEGLVRDGRIYGRGACDMKAGIAAAVYAAEAIRRAGVSLPGAIDISGTVDEESGGLAGVAWLAETRRLTAAGTDFVIIPEPLSPDRICVGHRGVYWFQVTTRGRTAHGSMPFLGVNAIEHMGIVLEAFRTELVPRLVARTTSAPVVPEEARHPTFNINGIAGGQPITGPQTPCVADVCRAIFDRRFLVEEGFESARREIASLLDRTARGAGGFEYELTDVMVVHPVRTPDDSPLVTILGRAVQAVLGRPATIVASPGTYDHKHVDRIAGIRNCVAYGPGILDLAHQPDEWCGIDDLVNATKVLALAVCDLCRSR